MGRRLFAGLAVVVFFVLLAGALALKVSFDYERAIEELHSTHLQGAVDLAEANDALWRLRYGFPQFMVLDAESRGRILSEEPRLYEEIERRLKSYAGRVDAAEERAALDALQKSYRRYVEARPKWFELYGAGQHAEAAAWRARTTTPFGAETVERFERQIALQQQLAKAAVARLAEHAANMQRALAVALLCALAAAIAIFFLAYRMLQPLKNLRRRAESVALDLFGTPGKAGEGDEVQGLISTFDATTARFVAHAKELAQTHDELTRLVAQMQQKAKEDELLYDLSDRLQSCHRLEEAGPVVRTFAPLLFPGVTGRLYVINASRNLLEEFVAWGAETSASRSDFAPEECWALRRSKSHRVTDLSMDVACAHIQPALRRPYLCIPIMSQGSAIGLLHMELAAAAEAGRARNDEIERVATTAAAQIGMAIANLQLRENLRRQSIRDPLTGLYNRRFMDETLDREIARAVRQHKPLAVLMLDIDHFKRFNDAYGHEAGDHVLEVVAHIMKTNFRATDVVCRFGGEEFTIIMPEAGLEAAKSRAEMLRDAIRARSATKLAAGAQLPPVTMSLGLALMPEHGDTPAALMQAADNALYEAKRKGRDRLEIAGIASPVSPDASPASG